MSVRWNVTRLQTKENERRDLELFLKLSPALGCPIIDEREAPDFELLFSEGMRVGLEVARVTDPAINADGAAMHRFADSVEESLTELEKPISVSIDFQPNHWEHANHSVRKRVHSNIVALCRELSNQTALPISVRGASLESKGITGISELYVARAKHTFACVGRTAKVSGALLTEHCLSQKDAKLDEYRSKNSGLQVYWLLLVAGRSFAEPRWKEGSRFLPHSTRYDRVFFLDVADQSVHEFGLAQG